MKGLNQFQKASLTRSALQYVYGGDPCGTSWTSVQTNKQGRDHYFDVNDNGVLDTGDEVYLDNGQTIIKNVSISA